MKHAARLSVLLITLAIIILWGGIYPGAIFGRTVSPPAAETDDRTLSPYFFVKSEDASVDQLPLKETSARCKHLRSYRGCQRHPGIQEPGHEGTGGPLRLSRLHKGGRVRDADDRRQPGHRGADREARGGPPGIRAGQRPGKERLSPRAAKAQCLPDERGEHPAR